MDYFADEYNHFGSSKNELRLWLESIFSIEPEAQAEVRLASHELHSDSTAVANWKLTISSVDKRNVLADSTFTGDRLVKRNGKWLLRGNQVWTEPPIQELKVIIEYFTFYGCPNCPPVEEELHNLELAFPNLGYLEYHTTGPLMMPGDQTFSYYGPFTVPTSIFQGETLVIGSGQAIANYAPLSLSLLQQENAIRYYDPVISVSMEDQTVSGSLTLDPQIPDFNYQGLVLNYVLIERVSSYNNTQGEPLRNVVRAKGSMAISASDMNNPLVFSLVSPTAIPEDASLVIFAQTKPGEFANDATIHGGIKIALDQIILDK